MSTVQLRIPKNNLDLQTIAPGNGTKFSPNLYAFMTSKRQQSLATRAFAYVDADGTKWLGYPDDNGLFVGAKLSQVLGNGAKAFVGAWTNLEGMKLIDGFWARYQKIGRCAIDEEHSMSFVGNETRWTVNGDSRSCLWCGNATQVMRRWTKTVECKAWENEPKA